MRTWTRARGTRECGGCGHAIRVGEPVLEYLIPARRPGGKAVTMIRCGPCEGGAPPDLPTALVLNETRPAIDLTRLGILPLAWSGPSVDPHAFSERRDTTKSDALAAADWKSSAANDYEREPGEEG